MSPGQRPHKPEELGPRIYRRGRWFACDLRPWGMGRPTMRNPKAPGWPDQGERTPLREVAERWRLAYWDLARGEHKRSVLGLAGRPMKLSEAVERYLAHRSATKERSTWSADRTALNHLLDHAGPDAATTAVTSRQLQAMAIDFLARRYRVSTLETYLKSIRVFFRWLGEHDPTEGVELPDPGEEDVQPWNDREIKATRDAARKVDHQAHGGNFVSCRMAVEAGLSMGLRQGEIFGLRWEDIDPEARTVRVRRQVPKDSRTPKGLKGKVARTAVVLPGWWSYQRAGIGYVLGADGQPVGTRTQRNMITRVLDTAGLNALGVGWHSLRHTYARLFLEAGGWMDELQRSMGHSSIQTTERVYGHLRPDRAAERASGRIYG